MLLKSTIRVTYLAQNLPKRLFSNNSSMLKVTIDEKTEIATLELNHPPVNSLNLVFAQEITQKIDELTKNRAYGFIFASSFHKVFCGGIDIQELHKPDLKRVEKAHHSFLELWYKIYSSPLLTAAAINGHSPGGGCCMALACDHRVMLPNFKIGLNEIKLGLEVPEWLRMTMRNVMKGHDADEAINLGNLFSTEDALKVGLIDEIANSKQEALEKCKKFMMQFKKVAPETRSWIKLGFRREEIDEFNATREETLQKFLRDIQKESFQKGIAQYLQEIKKKSDN